MSTTTTFLQLDELQQKPTTFHHCSSSGNASTPSQRSRQEGKVPIPKPIEMTQQVLLLKGVREQYTLVNDHNIPSVVHPGEILVKVLAIGLNPIDWKAPAFNFGIPSLPWINGRDLAGLVLQVPDKSSRLRVGDIVLVPSTDYRDIRKAAFQEYAISTDFNAARIPSSTSITASASLGVAFVASALALGVSLGLDFSLFTKSPGPNLSNVVNQLDNNSIPADILNECFASPDRPQRGDWIAIWGASTTTGLVTLQLAKLAGLRVICVADAARHGTKLLKLGADLLVDRQDTERAVEIIRGVTDGKLRYAIDIVGKETASKPSTSTSEPTKGNVPNRLLNNPSIKKVRLSGNEDSDLVSVRNSVLKLSSPGSRSSSASSKRPTFVPWDRDAFLERLETFRRVDRWTSKPTPINEVQWAKWGWVCTDVMRVSCISGCGGSVVVKLPDEIDELDGYDVEKVQERKEVRTRLVEEYSKRLREGHGENCPWRNKSCDATIQHLPLSNMDSAVARLRERYRNIMKMGDKLPSEDAVQTPEEFDMDSLIKLLPDDWSKDAETSTGEAGQATQASANGEEPTSQPTTEPTAEPSKSIHKAALAMACFGWDSVADGAAGLVGCKACFRRLGLWMYKPKENGDVTVYTSLDVASEHMEYCPWINRSAQSGTGNANEKVDNLRSGWQIVVEGCKVKHRRQLRSVASMNTLHSRPSTPFEENIPDDETEESRKSADREWWAKIRRVRHALTPKSSRKSTASKQ